MEKRKKIDGENNLRNSCVTTKLNLQIFKLMNGQVGLIN